MKSLSDNYQESHSSNHETFADLVFCAFVVLILFVLSLTIEVSNRVRGKVQDVATQEVKAEEVVKLTPQEMEELSKKLVSQSQEIDRLKIEVEAGNAKVKSQLAALDGEQRFTGAREQAAFSVGYDYKNSLYYFVSSRAVSDADRQRAGESYIEYAARKRSRLLDVAINAKRGRGFKKEEVDAIFASVSQYKMVFWDGTEYEIEQDNMHVYYHLMVCAFLAGESELSTPAETLVELAINSIGEVKGPLLEEMYPKCNLVVNVSRRKVDWNGVTLEPSELRDILLSVNGRGLMLDLEGFEGVVPPWLYEEVLAPSGYIGKTPKLPSM